MSTASCTSTIPQKLSPRKQLSLLKHHFTKGSFENLVGIVRSSLKNHKGGNLSVMANDIGKCISTVSYFFNDAVWDISTVRKAIRRRLLSSPITKIDGSEIAAFDESSISKKGTKFEFIGDTWDNADKVVHDGYSLLAVAIVNAKKGTRFVFDEILCSNKDPQWRGTYPYIERLLRRLFATTKIALVVFDIGFRNQYLVQYVLNKGKNFILRITLDMVLWSEDMKTKCKIRDIGKMQGVISYDFSLEGKAGWNVMLYTGKVNAWMKKVTVPLTVVVIFRPSFRKPMVLCTSLPVHTLEDALCVYEKYLNRWKIEMLFQDIKELGLESFRVRRKKAIIKYITIVILVHTLLTLVTHWARTFFTFSTAIQRLLRAKRKITSLVFRGMKIFYEILFSRKMTLTRLFATTLIKKDACVTG